MTLTPKESSLLKDLKGEEQLPVSRYKRVSTPYNNDALVERIMANDGWKYIAQYLMIDGGFNVNSTSVEAWAAVLQGLAKGLQKSSSRALYLPPDCSYPLEVLR